MDLFSYHPAYPVSAGFKGTDTSRAAAETINASVLRGKVLDAYRRFGPMTADQCAEALRIDRLSIRPRCSELKRLGKLRDTGNRAPNDSGKSAVVLQAAP